MAARVALSIPLLGMVGVFVAIGWSQGPWLPLGLVLATTGLLGAAAMWASKGRRLLKSDPAAGRRVLDAQSERVGQAMGRMISAWVAFSILFVLILLATRL